MAIEVQTTHNVTIDYEEANIFKRIVAYLIDWVIIIAWVAVCILTFKDIVMMDIFSGRASTTGTIILSIIMLVAVGYDLLTEYFFYGQSFGKMIVGIRVIKLDGTIPSPSEYLLRWLFRPVDFTITNGLLAVLMVACSKKSQRLGDYIAGTTVIDIRGISMDKILSIKEEDYADEYQVTYPNVLHDLTDRDIETIRTVLRDRSRGNTQHFMTRLIERIQSKEGYNFDRSMITDRAFLSKIINDYEFLAIKQ